MGFGDLHGLLGVGVPANPGLAELGFEDAKAAEGDLFALDQGGGDGVQSGVDDPLRIFPGKPRFFGNGGNK